MFNIDINFYMKNYVLLLTIIVCFTACKSSVKVKEDKIYSRHLQRYVDLTIISTQIPDNRSDMNLLLFNDAAVMEKIEVKKILDSLNHLKLLQPLVIVGINGKNNADYGLSELAKISDSKADKFSSFVINELLPYIKKKTVIRKFNSVAIFGNSLSGVSAFDIAWQNADKIDKAGIFSGDFNYLINSKKDSSNIVIETIRASRKRPDLDYWIYAASGNDSTIIKNSMSLTEIIKKKNADKIAGNEFIFNDKGENDIATLRSRFAGFLLWAFRK